MDPITHIIFAHIIAGQYQFSLPLALFAVILDFDHIYTYLSGKLHGAESRTIMHELPIAPLFMVFYFAVGMVAVYGIVSHIALDFLTGETKPFAPFNNSKINFNLPFPVKVVLGALFWAFGLMFIRV